MTRLPLARPVALALSASLLFGGCGKTDAPPAPAADASTGAASPANTVAAPAKASDDLVPLSRYGRSKYCSLTQTPDGTLHAIYTDQPDGLRSGFVYYRASKDNGATWGESKNLSDDESGLSPYYCRVLAAGDGKVYAVWKYLTAASDSLEGPGGSGSGILAYRVLDGGNWSPIVRLADRHHPMTSYFAALGPDGKVDLVWSQGNVDVDWEPMGGVGQSQANLIHQSTLDGATPQTRDLVTAKPIPTQQQIDAAHAAGHDIPYEDQRAKADGLWDLRGYIAKDGVARFIGDHQQPYPNTDNVGAWIAYFDGHALSKLFEYPVGDAESNVGNPWTLLADARGNEHVLRVPKKAETQKVRDYPIVGGKLGDRVDVIGPEKPEGSISDWQAAPLPGGRMAVTCAISQKGGWDPDDVELYVATTDPGGKWSTPVCVTNNAARQAFMSKQTAAGGVMKSDRYRPDFAEATGLKDGGLGIVMVNTNTSTLGITNNVISGSGQVYGSLATGSTAAPWVYFKKQ